MNQLKIQKKNKIVFGYCRVRTANQSSYSLEIQKQKIARWAEDRALETNLTFIRDSASGRSKRTKCINMIDAVSAGDYVVVVSVDRLGRKALDVLQIADAIMGKQANLIVLDLSREPIQSNSNYYFIFTIQAAIAERDYHTRKKKTLEGIEKAKRANKFVGRKPKVAKHQLKTFKEKVAMYRAKNLSYRTIAKELNVSRRTLYRYIKEE